MEEFKAPGENFEMFAPLTNLDVLSKRFVSFFASHKISNKNKTVFF